jgi:hypothetical protein
LAFENQAPSPANRLGDENERGPESGSLLFRVSPEQSVVCGSVSAVRDTLANTASEVSPEQSVVCGSVSAVRDTLANTDSE